MDDNQPQKPGNLEKQQSSTTLLSLYLDEHGSQIPGQHTFDGNPKFLEPNNTFEKIALVSYPRSGNSLLRGHLERITGILTGSDGRVTRSLNAQLKEYGLLGEGITDQRVWIIKSHYPERLGQVQFKAQKIVLLVRNPLDVFNSFFNMIATGSHNISVADTEYSEFKSLWEQFVEDETGVWDKFHHFWLRCPLPVYIVRYEDLLNYPHETLLNLFKFLLNVRLLKGTLIDQTIRQHLTAYEGSPALVYKPRVGKFNAHYHLFSEKQKIEIKMKLKELLKKFGYMSSNIKSATNVFLQSDEDGESQEIQSSGEEVQSEGEEQQSLSQSSKEESKEMSGKASFMSSSSSESNARKTQKQRTNRYDAAEQAKAISKVEEHFASSGNQLRKEGGRHKLFWFESNNGQVVKHVSQFFKVLSNGTKIPKPNEVIKRMTLNDPKSLLRVNAPDDPEGRGMRFYKNQLRGRVKLKEGGEGAGGSVRSSGTVKIPEHLQEEE